MCFFSGIILLASSRMSIFVSEMTRFHSLNGGVTQTGTLGVTQTDPYGVSHTVFEAVEGRQKEMW